MVAAQWQAGESRPLPEGLSTRLLVENPFIESKAWHRRRSVRGRRRVLLLPNRVNQVALILFLATLRLLVVALVSLALYIILGGLYFPHSVLMPAFAPI